jgi:WD40 repeat protein
MTQRSNRSHRHRLVIAACAGLVLALAAVIWWPVASIVPVAQVPAAAPTSTSLALPASPLPALAAAITPENAGQLVQLARWGIGQADLAAWSPSGEQFAIATNYGVALYDARTRQQLRFIETAGYVRSLAFSPDGVSLAVGTHDGQVIIWEVASGRLLHTFADNPGPVTNVRWSPGGRLLAVQSEIPNGGIPPVRVAKVWDVATARVALDLQGGIDQQPAVAFSPDGQLLAAHTGTTVVTIREAGSMREQRTLAGPVDKVRTMAFSPDGRLLAAVAEDGKVWVWDVAKGNVRHTLALQKPFKYGAVALAFSPDGSRLAAAGTEGTATTGALKIWNLASGRELTTHEASLGSYTKIELHFTSDGRLRVASGWSSSERDPPQAMGATFGEIGGASTLHRFSRESFRGPPDIALSPDGTTLIIAGAGALKLLDMATGEAQPAFAGYAGNVRALAFAPDGAMLATASDDQIALWATADGRPLRTLAGHTQAIFDVAFSPDGRLLASAAADGTVRLWDALSGAKRRVLAGHGGEVRAIAFAPDGRLLASGYFDGTITIWDVASGAALRTIARRDDTVFNIAFAPDGRVLATAGMDKTVRLWDATSGTEIRALTGHTDRVDSLAFSPDGQQIVSGGGADEEAVRVWDATSGRQTRVLGQVSGADDLSFAPGGRLLAAGGYGLGTVWDMAQGKALISLSQPGDCRVAFAPDGRLLATASDDGMIRLWGVR